MPYVVEIYDLEDAGHGELLEIVTRALEAKSKNSSRIRVSYYKAPSEVAKE